ncbi:sel1 repeat family protein [Mesorhizobium sp. NPDC059054]|uniref:tetratricopeptide repeat protein n=1 Tax=Mesorhizobium sp. NPDC059054 TaxID=3346711 RepID=UPI0036965285
MTAPSSAAPENPAPATPATNTPQPVSPQAPASTPGQPAAQAPKAPEAATPAGSTPAAAPQLPQPIPLPGSSAAAKGDRPIANPLPQPATTTEPAANVDPARFGGRPPDAAYGAYQRGLYKTAYNLALERANKGDAPAQTLVAEILARGLGMPANAAEAAKWYQRAAEQGVPEAQFQYALILIDGRQVKKDEKKAQVLLQAAAEAGNPLAQFNLAQLLIQKDPGEAGLARAAIYYQKAAESGLADAQYAMAQIYANGAGGRTKDDNEARRLLVLAARQNYDTAQLDLGQWLIDGRGGKRDLKSGFNWTKRAAEGGNVAAQNRLAKLYVGGIGVDGDLVSAAAWFIVARRAGLADPQMDDFMQGLDEEQTKKALQKANRLP